MATLTPAYGRDYKSKKEVIAALESNKDFIYNDITSPWSGKPYSLSDLPRGSYTVRYKSNRQVMVYTKK